MTDDWAENPINTEKVEKTRRPIVLPCNPHNERLKRHFLEFEHEAMGKSESSIRSYEIDLLRFESHFSFRNFGKFTKQEAKAFKDHLIDGPLTMPVVKATLKTVKAFLTWLGQQKGYKQQISLEAIEYLNLTAKERRMAGRIEKIVPCPTPQQVEMVIAKMPTSTLLDRRNQSMIALLGMTAIRSSAIPTLRLKHVDLTEKIINQESRDVATKFSKNIATVLIPIIPNWLEIFSTYVAELRTLGYEDCDPLFPKTAISSGPDAKFGERHIVKEFMADAQTLPCIIKTNFANVGLPQYTVHSFRHMHTRLADEHGVDLGLARAVSANLGHSTPKITYASYGKQSLQERRDLIYKHYSKQGEAPNPEGTREEFFEADQAFLDWAYQGWKRRN